MKSFMDDLYFGRIIPWERPRCQDPDYTPTNRKISDIKTHFEDTMTADEYKKFEELTNLCTKSTTMENVDVFAYGLNMGILLMIEVMNFKDKALMEQEL